MSIEVSIIVCTRGNAASLRQTLAAIGRCCIRTGLTIELVIVDNGSADDTRQVVENYGMDVSVLRYVYEPQKGKGFAYNAGVARAKGDILLFTDDDVQPKENWIVGMSRPILEGKAVATAGEVTIAPDLQRPWFGELHRSWLAERRIASDGSAPFAYLVGANMAISRAAMLALGPVDVCLGPGALGFGEDMLLGFRLWEGGHRPWEVAGAGVVHHFDGSRLTRAGFLSIAERMGRSEAYLAHHWHHWKIRLPRARQLKHAAERWAWRRRNRVRADMADAVEMKLAFDVAFFRSYAALQGTPRKYPMEGRADIFDHNIGRGRHGVGGGGVPQRGGDDRADDRSDPRADPAGE